MGKRASRGGTCPLVPRVRRAVQYACGRAALSHPLRARARADDAAGRGAETVGHWGHHHAGARPQRGRAQQRLGKIPRGVRRMILPKSGPAATQTRSPPRPTRSRNARARAGARDTCPVRSSTATAAGARRSSVHHGQRREYAKSGGPRGCARDRHSSCRSRARAGRGHRWLTSG
jgi:hypothetical protein